jgi:hypothetical protein
MLQGLEGIYDATSDYSQKKLQLQPSDGPNLEVND